MSQPHIAPPPPVAEGLGLPWDVAIDDPVEALALARRALGDTFAVDSGPDRYLFTFCPTGVRSFYALPEERASKGVADWKMLRRKLPDELFSGRRTLPHQLFGREDVATYLANADRALSATVQELGPEGEVEVFALARRLGHRGGLASWGGPGSAEGQRFERLVAAFDALDGAEAFVHPDAMAQLAASGKAAEYEALGIISAELSQSLSELGGRREAHPLFDRIARSWDDEPPDIAGPGVAGDVALIHVASMSNLFAALGWALVDLFEHPAEADRVRRGERARTEACALESTRMAQRSIMARYVVAPIRLATEAAIYAVEPGVTVATLLPLTNLTSAPGLEDWDPDHWRGRRLADPGALATIELVTAFGHGRHTCPAQPFSLSVMTGALERLLATYECQPLWSSRSGPVRAQIGGVARPAGTFPLRYRRR